MTPAQIAAAIAHEYATEQRVEMIRRVRSRELAKTARKRFLNHRAERALKFAAQGRTA